VRRLKMTRNLKLLLLIGIAIVTVGCGTKTSDDAVLGRPKVIPTSIKVARNGEPVEGATVTLRAVDANRGAFCRTNSRGVCQLTTFQEGDGAVAGEYRVAIRKVDVVTTPNPTDYDPEGVKVVEERHLIPRRYETFGTSELTVTVTEDGENEFELDLTN
jgi:hypothetical protein